MGYPDKVEAIYDKLVFDSDLHEWDINSSEFDKLIFNKDHLLFLLQQLKLFLPYGNLQ